MGYMGNMSYMGASNGWVGGSKMMPSVAGQSYGPERGVAPDPPRGIEREQLVEQIDRVRRAPGTEKPPRSRRPRSAGGGGGGGGGGRE